jgi:sulfide:quinone oxidoreductase
MKEPTMIAPGLAVAAQPDKFEIEQLARSGFRTIINNRRPGEEAGQWSPDEERAEAERQGLTYVHLPVTLSTVTADDVEAFRQAVRDSPKPIAAHCKSGGRSYLMWAVGEALAGARDPADLQREAAAAGYELQSLPGLLARMKS